MPFHTYMQFPVPQFTEVEDKIIGPLTVKQFGILLVTGGVIFAAYSSTKDVYVTGVAAFLVGLPGLVLTFGQFNGRPVYASLFIFLNHWTRPKFFIFRKQSATMHIGTDKESQIVQTEAVPAVATEDPRERLRKIQYQLESRATQEVDLLGKKKENK